MVSISKVLIANRGEIACRVIRTCRRLGVATVAIFSDADADALHVAQADEAVRIGTAPARESYLSIPAVLAAAAATCADAIHPGYGFLSENADFVDACEAAGLIFIGPPASAVRLMGGKDAAKAIAARAGVPVLAGACPADQSDDGLAAVAAEVGFPLLLKAVAGGGGRGMRRVDGPGGLAAAARSARREAASAFGDDRLMLERFVPVARHIEVQVLADGHGKIVHLFERDCSIQRRHQKIVEEAPAPGVTPKLRAAMGVAATALCRAVDYRGVGTVEFIVDASSPSPDRFWFMEMNTRLQVEHTVTEAITGLDLVEEQLRVAAGRPLRFGQDDLTIDGHAIEMRLCAEDPTRNYLPSPGILAEFDLPGAPARVDTGLRRGDEVTPWYDNLLAKIVIHGANRAEAMDRMHSALADTRVEGLATNLGLLRATTSHAEFRKGGVTTDFLERHKTELLEGDRVLV